MLAAAIERIRQMERYFDMLQNTAPHALRGDPSLQTALRTLIQYYENGQWLKDYQLDEQGLLPQGLKRGVLSQDALYDLLERICPFVET